MLCGITHAVHALSPFELPTVHAFFKVLCGLVSIITAVYLVKFIPAALKLPNYTAYLEYEIQERQMSELSLRNKNEEMKKLRFCTEKIRQTLNVQSILFETTSCLYQQLELNACAFITYSNTTNSLKLVAPYSGEEPEAFSLRSTAPDALQSFNEILDGDHIRLLELRHSEALFGPQGNYFTAPNGASLPISKSTVCSHISLPDDESALLILRRNPNGMHWTLSEIEMVRDVTNQVEIALDQARAIERDKELLLELQSKNRELEQAQHRAEMATQAKSKFIAIMSHEMRTPLYVVTALTELLMDSPLNNDQRESLETIATSSKLLLSIISDVLDYSKFQQDNFIMDKSPFNIRTCIEKSLELGALKAREKNLEMHYFLGESFPEVIDTDESRLSQVFLNLISNAIKFTDKGGLHIEGFLERYLTNDEIASLSRSTKTSFESPVPLNFSVYNSSHMPHSSSFPSNAITTTAPQSNTQKALGTQMALLHFVVRDTGVGIARDQIGRLFKEFTQLDTAVNRKYEGTGLGLAICRKVVTLMGGHIWIESTPGLGSQFHFTIIAKVPPSRISSTLVLPVADIKGAELLVVSGSDLVKHQFSDFWNHCDVKYSVVSDVPAALEYLGSLQHKISGIFVDIKSLVPVIALDHLEQLDQLAPVILITDSPSQLAEYNLKHSKYSETALIKPLRYMSVHSAVKLLIAKSGIPLIVPLDHPPSENSPRSQMSRLQAKQPPVTRTRTPPELISGSVAPFLMSHSAPSTSLARSPSSPDLPINPRHQEHSYSIPITPNIYTKVGYSLSPASNSSSSSQHQVHSQSDVEPHDTADNSGTSSQASSSVSSESPKSSPRESPASAIKILLVEDNFVCRKVCIQQLHKLGFQNVAIAEDGAVAVSKVKKEHFDVVMMDVMMPVVDGLTATRLIRAQGSEGLSQQPYIIAITASSMLEEGSREACLTAGMDDVVNKPIHLKALRDALDRYTSERKKK